MTNSQLLVLLIPLWWIAGSLAVMALHVAGIAGSLRRIAGREDATGQAGDVQP